MTGAGGNIGAGLTQYIFFTSGRFNTHDGILFMGVMSVACTLPVALIYFPQWGGMFCPPSKGIKEEDYYNTEYDSEERRKGMNNRSMLFAESSRSERGKNANYPSSFEQNSTA